MSDDTKSLEAHVNAAAQAGYLVKALPRLDTVLAASPHRNDVRLLRAMTLLSLGRPDHALDDLDHVLVSDPDADAARFQRAIVLFQQERLWEALQDFTALTVRRPQTVEPWANAGMILLRMERFSDALPLLQEAARIQPQRLSLRRSLANALYGTGRIDDAIQAYESVLVAAPNDTATLTDYAMALLGVARPGDAHKHLQTALRVDPADQTALAGLYLSANELGLTQTVNTLMDYARLLWVGTRPSTAPLDSKSLRRDVLAHPGLVWQPAGRSTQQGRQSPMLDLSSGSPFEAFGLAVRHVVSERLSTLRADPALRTHPWVRTLPHRWRLQAWCTVLDAGGRQTPHIHPAGRLSGVYYLDTGNAIGSDAGTLTLGCAPPAIRPTAAPLVQEVAPENDQFCCFPSYFFHHTTPFRGTHGPRISLAFDVIPAP